MAERHKVYNLLASAEVNHVITYTQLDNATDTDFRASSRPGLDKDIKTLEAEESRTVECVRNDCTIGEIVTTLKTTFGEHREQGF